MAKLLCICAFLACLQLISCRVARDTAAQTLDISELAKQGEAALQELNQKFLDILGVKSNDELAEAVQAQGKQYVEKVEGFVQQISEEATKSDGIVQTIAGKIKTAVDELKQYTETSPDVQKAQEEFQKRLETVLKETEEFGNKIKEQGKDIPANIDNALKGIVNNTFETAKKLVHEVDTAIKEKKN